jgi:hypothetical protein
MKNASDIFSIDIHTRKTETLITGGTIPILVVARGQKDRVPPNDWRQLGSVCGQ